MNKKVFAGLIFVMAFGNSCTVYREYAIEVFRPEQVRISPDVKNVALLNRNFKYENDTLTTFYKSDNSLKKDRKISSNAIDSLLVTNCFEGFVSTCNENNSFKKVAVLPPNLIKKHYGEKLGPLNWDVVDKLTTPTQSDLLISLETFSAFFSEYPVTNEAPASNEVVTVAVWAVYDPARKKEIERKSMIDTLYWNGTDESGKPEKLPSRQIALEVASRVAGQAYAKRFSSSWEKVNRIYSIPPLEDFRVAAAFFEEGKYDEAKELWIKYTPKKNGRLSITACYNMALVSEMADDIDEALRWINLALQQAVAYRSQQDIESATQYRNILLGRRKEMQQIMQKQGINGGSR